MNGPESYSPSTGSLAIGSWRGVGPAVNAWRVSSFVSIGCGPTPVSGIRRVNSRVRVVAPARGDQQRASATRLHVRGPTHPPLLVSPAWRPLQVSASGAANMSLPAAMSAQIVRHDVFGGTTPVLFCSAVIGGVVSTAVPVAGGAEEPGADERASWPACRRPARARRPAAPGRGRSRRMACMLSPSIRGNCTDSLPTLPASRLDLVRGDRPGSRSASRPANSIIREPVRLVVDHDVVPHRTRMPRADARVEPAGQRRRQDPADEVRLPADPAEVAGPVGLPLTRVVHATGSGASGRRPGHDRR